jgi:hypothetical protein
MTENKRYRWHVIYDRIKHIENPVGAEIGVHRGECSGHLLELHPGLKLYMIDMWSPDTYKGKGDDAATEPYRKIYQEECDLNRASAELVVEKYKPRTELIPLESLEAVELINFEELDFAFIDASHAYEDVKADILSWLPKIKKGGYLFCHDYGLFEGVTRAVQELFPSDAKHLNWPELDSDYMAVVRV